VTKSGLECFLENFPLSLRAKKSHVCHAASITSSCEHLLHALTSCPDARLPLFSALSTVFTARPRTI